MVTIILKGKIHSDINKVLKYYKSISDQVIISTWKDQSVEYVIDFENTKYVDHIIESEYPLEKNNSMKPYYSLLCQTHNILEALKIAKNDLIIILRLDEYYHNLHLFIKKFKNEPDKLITGNTYFRPADALDGMGVLHPSDHIICQNKDRLIACYQRIYDLFMVKERKLQYPLFEAILAQCYIETFGDKNIRYKSKHKILRKKYLTFINVEELKDYKITNNRTQQTFHNNFNPDETKYCQISVKNESEI